MIPVLKTLPDILTVLVRAYSYICMTGTSKLETSFFFPLLKKYIYWLCYYSCPISRPPSLHSILPTPSLPHSPYISCPWVILISSLASTFPTLFLPSPCLFSTYHLCYLFSIPSPPLPLPLPYWQPSMWSPSLWFCSCCSCLPSLLLFLF